MLTEPKLEARPAQPYVGIRSQVPWSELGTIIPQSLDELFGWLSRTGASQPTGTPFIRYHVINMEDKLDIELGVPVPAAVAGEGRIQPGLLPAGRYASLVYTGVANGVPANGALLDWGASQGLQFDRWDVPEGDAFAGRYESFITDPDTEPDPAKWETEVAIKIAEAP